MEGISDLEEWIRLRSALTVAETSVSLDWRQYWCRDDTVVTVARDDVTVAQRGCAVD